MTATLIILVVLAAATLLSMALAYAAIQMARQADRDSLQELLAHLPASVEPPAPAPPAAPVSEPKARPLIIRWPRPTVQTVVAPPVPPPQAHVVAAPASAPASAPRTVTLRLMSAKGRLLDTIKIDARTRRPTLQYRLRKGEISTFVASDHRSDTGEWEYRRVGVEKE